MENALYAALARQSGLARELQAIANNIANQATTGFRREGVVFAEHVRRAGTAPSLSIAHANARSIDLSQGEIASTGGDFDVAIQGQGFFLLETPGGPRLTRSGHFTQNAAGELVSVDGHRLLDAGQSPIFVPPDARTIGVGSDGTLVADGQPVARIGLFEPDDPLTLRHESGTILAADGHVPASEPGAILQGRLEAANVNPMSEIARMIEVSRAYEAGQGVLDQEDQRIRSVIDTLGRR
jgi:flagellar basal-body rod protein FlgF